MDDTVEYRCEPSALVIFQSVDEVEPWYECIACGWHDVREGWGPVDWGCPDCGKPDETYPMDCNFGVQHEDGTIDNHADCTAKFREYGEVVRGGCGCSPAYRHRIAELKDELRPTEPMLRRVTRTVR